MLTVKRSGNWKLYWGVMPLPSGAEALGIVSRETGTGALIRLANRNYVQGNAGGTKSLPQREVDEALAVSNAAAVLGRKGGIATSEEKTKANRAKANAPPKEGKLPRGRPRGSKNKPKDKIVCERLACETAPTLDD